MAKEKAEAPIHEREILTSELAAIVGKSSRWIRQITNDAILKQVSRGKYRLDEAVQAYIEHASGGKQDDGKPRYIDEKTEHERIKKERAALELARMRGELHHSSDVELVMNDMITAFRQKILSIPTKLSPQLVSIDEISPIKSKLTDALHEALKELSEYDQDMFRVEHARADADAET